jgi:hypothetical protein
MPDCAATDGFAGSGVACLAVEGVLPINSAGAADIKPMISSRRIQRCQI